MGLSRPLRIFRVGPARGKFSFGHKICSLLINLVRSTWLEYGFVLFLKVFIDLDLVLVHEKEENPKSNSTHLDLMLVQ